MFFAKEFGREVLIMCCLTEFVYNILSEGLGRIDIINCVTLITLTHIGFVNGV